MIWILFLVAKESHLFSSEYHTAIAAYATEHACERARDHAHVSYEEEGMTIKKSLCIKDKVRKDR